MTKLSEQVREAMDKLNRISIVQSSEGFVTPTRPASYAVSDREYDFLQEMRSLTPKLLAEHEAMERFVEAVKHFPQGTFNPDPQMTHTPCIMMVDDLQKFIVNRLATLDKELKEIK